MSFKVSRIGNTSSVCMKPDNISLGVVAFVSLLFTSFIIGFFYIAYQLITGEIHFAFIVFSGLFFWGAYYNFFNFYFLLVGNEIIEIEDEIIKQTREVWKIRHSKTFKKSKIKQIEIVDNSNRFGASGISLIGLTSIHIRFKYGMKKRVFGKHLSIENARSILDELNNKKYATQQAIIK